PKNLHLRYVFRPFRARTLFIFVTRGDALRACPWLLYCAPSALLRICDPLVLAIILPAFGAASYLRSFGAGYYIARLRRCFVFAILWCWLSFCPPSRCN